MAITTDPSTPIGQVRLLITDLTDANALFTDEQITAFLTQEGNNVKLASATALEVIARSEVLISKAVSNGTLSTNGPAVGAELRASAQLLRDQVTRDEQLVALMPVWAFPDPVPWGDEYL